MGTVQSTEEVRYRADRHQASLAARRRPSPVSRIESEQGTAVWCQNLSAHGARGVTRLYRFVRERS
jgi:hypothetical protein